MTDEREKAIRSKLAEAHTELVDAQLAKDYARIGELRYGTIPALEKMLVEEGQIRAKRVFPEWER